jgi:glycosyltransferase involved in cell wall biosynthesis
MFSKYFKPSYYIGVSEELTNWAIGNWKIPYNRCITLINLPSQNNIKTNNDFFENGGLVMVGNIKTIKNQSFALELVKELREQIDIIGKVQDLDYYNKICNIYPEGVNFRLKIDNISHLLGRYKIGLFCSISESGPLVLLEYFVQGLPFIAYRTGGISDVLFKYVPQYFMDTFDMNCWVEKYQQLNENYSRIPVELINDVLRIEFDSEKYGEELISIYKLSEECVC